MKRRIALTLIVAAAVLPTACRQPASPAAVAEPAQDGWVMPPIIDAVTPSQAGLIVRGQAAPSGRVVVRAAEGPAYAAGADADGRFELRIPRPRMDALFIVEARSGQVGYPAPYRLLVAADPAGPIGLLTIGAPTRRLDVAGGLDAIDSDGQSAFLSGRTEAGSVVEIEAGVPRTVTAGPDGRWSVSRPGNGASPVAVEGVVSTPPAGRSTADDMLERVVDGWRISWSTPGGGRQTTWFPDRR
ncbi:MAG: hypothetical protein KKA16_11340 [Alphaproteobacteria bacterium]|nr:hypothetical protein [Alphaproteobacteria bacterium]MBU2380813.1 hypothetical protein [Alphaproteobacteria bacterium]